MEKLKSKAMKRLSYAKAYQAEREKKVIEMYLAEHHLYEKEGGGYGGKMALYDKIAEATGYSVTHIYYLLGPRRYGIIKGQANRRKRKKQ